MTPEKASNLNEAAVAHAPKEEKSDAEKNELLQKQNNEQFQKTNDALIKETNITHAEMDYFTIKGDVDGFQKSVIASYETGIKETEENYKHILSNTKNTSLNFNAEGAKQDADNKIKAYKERIEWAKSDPKGRPEYANRVDPNPAPSAITGVESVSGLNVVGLVARYAKEIENYNKLDKEHFGSEDKRTQYPHKFDKLLGLADIAFKQKDAEALQTIKSFGERIKLPNAISDKIKEFDIRSSM